MFHRTRHKKVGLKIIIVGCGKVGITLTEQLRKEEHDITIVDIDPKCLQDVADMYDVMGVVGNGASYSVLMEAGIQEADLIIAVTDSDELNLLCCTVAKRTGDCAAIARVRTPDYSEEVGYLRDKLGLTMIINPELEAAVEIGRILCLPTALEVNAFAHGLAEMVKVKIPEGNFMAGRTIADVAKNTVSKVLISAVERGNEVYIPSGDFILQAGDLVSFTASRRNVRAFLKELGFLTNQVKNTMIVGGGKAGYYLAKHLIGMGINVKIIERSFERCNELSTLLPEAIVINADGTEEDVLKEEGIADAESFVALTGIDEENIMVTLYAKKVSKAKVITKVNRIAFKNVISDLELGSVVYPKYITSEAIIAYVRAKSASKNTNIETLYHLFDSRVEATEFRIEHNSKVLGTPLMKMKLKDNLLVAIINRDGKIIIPRGNDTIELGDTVVVVTKHTGLNTIEDILK